MKKITSILLALAACASLSVSSVSASGPVGRFSYTAGDSIAYTNDAHKSFASLATLYLMNSDITSTGFYSAVNGETTSETLEKIKNDNGSFDEKYAEYIYISTGGNDYLDAFEAAVAPYMEEGDTLASLNEEKIAVLKEKIAADQANFMTKLNAASAVTASASENAKEIVSFIKEENPSAEIYFLEIYNPFESFAASGDSTLTGISTYADSLVSAFNKNLAGIEGIHVVPVHDAFKGKSADYIIENDIHPTLAGHIKIASLILSDITGEDEKTILGKMYGDGNSMNNNGETVNMITEDEFASLPSYMKEGVTPLKFSEAETTSAEVTAIAEVSASVSETTAASDVTEALSTSAETTVTTEITSSSSATSASVSSAASSPSTSDRGLSSVVVSGFFAAAAACVAFRKKSDK